MKMTLAQITVCSLLLLKCMTGCDTSPNLVLIHMPGLEAKGDISRQGDRINFIELDPREIPKDQLNDIWIGFPSDDKMNLSAIAEADIHKLSKPSTNYYPNPTMERYYFSEGYNFGFTKGQFTRFEVNTFGFPPRETTAFVKLGSRRTGAMLSFPCSMDEFENVSGSTGNISRQYVE